MDGYHDAHHRLLPGVVPGWGMSWWWYEQGITREQTNGDAVVPAHGADLSLLA